MITCYEDFMDFVCGRIATLRIKRDISARDMSLSMGQGQGYINNIENKNNLPSMQGLYYICEFFNISPKDFFDEGVGNPERFNDLINDLKALDDEQLANVAAIVKGLRK